MQTGRSYLRVLMLASAMVLASTDVGFSQESTDRASVNARAATIAADIDGRVAKSENEDAKKCLREKKTAVTNLKSSAATSTDLSGLLAELNEVAGQLDSCTSGPNGGPGSGSGVQMKVDADTPDPAETNPTIAIPPGPQAAGPGVIGAGEGPDFGGGGVGGSIADVGITAPVIPPPPVSPTL